MNKFRLLLVFFLTVFPGYMSGTDTAFLENVYLDPDHGEMNIEGKVDIFFNLSDPDAVVEGYLTVMVGTTEVTLTSTISDGSSMGYFNNKMTIRGSELYDILETYLNPPALHITRFAGEKSIEDSNDFSWADGIYDFTLVIEMEDPGTEEEEEDIFDDGSDLFEDEEEEEEPEPVAPATATSSFRIVFDNIPPSAPLKVESEGGDERIILKITPPYIDERELDHDKIGRYHITLSGIFDRDGDEVEAELEYVSSVSGPEYDEVWETSVSGKDGFKLINNDENLEKYLYTIKISAEDVAGNHDPENWIEINASAVSTFGFWSYYKAEGGKEKGGFCFIASAGFGSYSHPYVKILRNFRDSYLEKWDKGKQLINVYYSFGYYPASLVENYPVLKPLARVFLIPFVITVWFFTESVGNLILIMWLLLSGYYILGKLKRKTAIFFLPLFIVFSPNLLEAVGGEFSFTNSFYYPSEIDSGIDTEPFRTVGGTKKRYLPSVTFGFQVPVLEEYIRWSLVGGIGFTRFKGTAVRADGEKSADSTRMHFIPLTGEVKVRPAYSFPVWPYAGFGLDYVVWWIREKEKTAKHGGTFGFHGSLGLMISLNWLDQRSAQKFEQSTGISNTALFAHYRFEKINDFGKENSFDLGNSRFEFGIVFEF